MRSVSHLLGFYGTPSATGSVLLKDRPSLRSPFVGNNSLIVFGEELFKQLSLCYGGFTFQQMTCPSCGQGDQRVGLRGHYNDFLKSICRGYKLDFLSHFSHYRVAHSLCLACFHATPGCVWGCGGEVSGMGDQWDPRGEVQTGNFSTRFSWTMSPPWLWALGWIKRWNKKQDSFCVFFSLSNSCIVPLGTVKMIDED